MLRRRRPEVPDVLLAPGRPRWREHLAPAVVILGGVLVVVLVGVAALVSRSGRHPENDPVAGAAAEPTLDQVPIPLPSPSLSTSPAPINAITVEQGTVPDSVDLSDEGKVDWVHWGEEGVYSLERDAGGNFAILEGTPDAPRRRHTVSPERFRWSGGTPAAGSGGATSGIRTCGAGNGFTLSAPATPQPRKLRLYLGVLNGQGLLRLKLTTGGKTVTSRLDQRGSSLRTAKYTVSYRATGPGKISIEWITEKSFDDDCGGVALEAATLF
ncbi:hypothetical protein [Actinoplanes siamensis]|uniref:Uncharacterized protein n=1 Tax=Actinoplanes siamensis TaxID=1223317 RepID=A0A919THY0_9ACTN|nr:hypothetical protein [Actinoplanes siamensis]GIF03772.1 hypothetical protein Asi03nite_13100 [Actinoplanes siamensis]